MIIRFIPLVSLFLFNFSHYLAIPLIGIISEKSVSMIALSMATVLSVKSVCENIAILFTGYISDRISSQISHFIGSVIRLFAFVSLSQNQSFAGLLIFATLVGLGSAFCRPSNRSIISLTTAPSEADRTFRLVHILMNLGAIIGPLLALPVSKIANGPLWLIGMALLELLISAAQYVLIKPVFRKDVSQAFKIKNVLLHFKEALGAQSIKNLVLLQILFWFFIGISICMIVAIQEIHPTLSWSKGYLFSMEGVAAILFQFILVKSKRPYAKSKLLRVLGFAALPIGVLFFLVSNSIFIVAISIILFGLGDAVVGPYLPAKISQLAKQSHLNISFSSLFLAEGIGETIGYYFGAFLLKYAGHWQAFALLLLASVISALLLSKVINISDDKPVSD